MTIKDSTYYGGNILDAKRLRDHIVRGRGPGNNGEIEKFIYDRSGGRKAALRDVADKYHEFGNKYPDNPHRGPLKALIAEALEVGGWSYTDVARQTGLTRGAVSSWHVKS